MSEQTAIQWTDSTWNIVTGCTRVGPGCARCYIERTPPFRMNGRRFAPVGNESTTGVTLHWDRLLKVPRGPKVFTPSLGDLFHDEVPDIFIASAFDVMRKRPDRIFQVLTKRPERAADWFSRYAPAFKHFRDGEWPLPNVWLGVSIENARYTWRADVLREIPAAVRFISAEPLLGSLFDGRGALTRAPGANAAARAGSIGNDALESRPSKKPLDLSGIDWVIIGGESGPKSRPFHLEHAREIVRAAVPECDCFIPSLEGAGQHSPGCAVFKQTTAVFVKQLGARPVIDYDVDGHPCSASVFGINDRKGGDWDEWIAKAPDLRIREFPRTAVLA